MEKLLNISDYELLSKKVYRLLKSEIMKGSFKPRTKLSEVKIAEQMGISRTPIREAFRELAAKGFVEMNPNQGVIVSGISIKDLREVLQIRRILEGLAARLAAPLITKEKIRELEICNKNMKKLIKEKDILAFGEESTKFHFIILKVCENNRLVQILKNLAEQIYRFRNTSLSVTGRPECA